MPTTPVGVTTNAPQLSSVSSVGTQKTPRQLGAGIGDLIVVLGAHERSGTPTLGGIAGLTVAARLSDTDFAAVIGWKRLVEADLDSAPTLTADGTTKRMSLAAVVRSRAGDPTFVVGPRVTQAGSDVTAEHPDVTPPAAGADVFSLTAALSNVEPYQRSFAPAAGWTELVETGSTATDAINAYTMVSTRAGGAAGAAVPGNVVSDVSSPPTRFAYWPVSMYVLEDTLPVVGVGPDITDVLPYAPVAVAAVASGGAGSYGYSWAQTAGPAVTLRPAGRSCAFDAPPTVDGTTVRLRCTVTDAAGKSRFDEADVTVRAHPDFVRRVGALVPFERLVRRGQLLVGAARTVLLDGTSPTPTTPDPEPEQPSGQGTYSGASYSAASYSGATSPDATSDPDGGSYSGATYSTATY